MRISSSKATIFAVVTTVVLFGGLVATAAFQATIRLNAHIASLEARVVEAEGRADQALAAIDLDAQYSEIVRVVAETATPLTPIQVVNVARVIQEQSILYSADGITPSLLLALMKRESDFDPFAFSNMKASGIMQVIEGTALIHLPSLGYDSWEHVRFDPVINIQVGVAELVRLRRGYVEEGVETSGDSWTYTLHSYRWGPRNTRLLMDAKETRIAVPSLEYSVGVRELQLAYQTGGLN